MINLQIQLHLRIPIRKVIIVEVPSKGSNLEQQSPPIVTMTDQRTMAELLRAPTEGFAEPIVVPSILADSNSEIAKLTHAVNQQTSAITTTMTALLKQFQATPPPALVKVVEEICITCEGSGSLPSNTVANPQGELKSITTRSSLVTDGPTIPTHLQSVNPEVDEHVEETFTDPDLAEYTIKVPPPSAQKYKPPSQREFIVHQMDPRHPNIPYPSRMLKQKQQEKVEVEIQNFGKSVILKKLPEKLGDPGKFLIPCGFSELKYKALANLGASIKLMPLSVWKKLGLPKLIPTRITLELANRVICTPAGIARDVFVPVGKFTFPADFVIVDYESDPRVPLILGRPFLRTARALIDVYGEEMILHDDYLEDLFPYQPSGNPTFSPHPELTSSEVNNDIFDLEGCNVLSEKLPDLDSIKDLHPPLYDNPLSGSTTYFSNSLLEDFADELPSDYDDNLQFNIESDLKEIEFLLYQDKDSSLKDSIDQKEIEILLYQGKDFSLNDSIDQKDLANLADIFVDPIPEMLTDKHAPDYSSPLIFDVHDDDYLEVESDAGNVYDVPFDSRVDALPSTNNEDKVFNPGILIHEKPIKIITRVVQEKKLVISNAFLVLEDFDPYFYEPLFFKEVPNS
nr:hypothetical protein [Tanacetum cinerariifolium]